jgi:hypothetical protein
MTETASQWKAVNEFRKLFQKHDEWKASIYLEGTSLEISMLEKELAATWSSGGSLPFACYSLAGDLNWNIASSGELGGGIYKVKIYPREDS